MTEIADIKGTLTATFKQRVAALIKTLNKGKLLVIAPNDTLTPDYKITELNTINFTMTDSDLKTKLKMAYRRGPVKVILFEYKTDLEDVIAEIDKLKFDWMCGIDANDQATIADYADEKEKFAVVYNVNADSKYVVSVANPSAVLADGVQINGSSEIEGIDLVPLIAGLCCGCPYNMSVTAYTLTELKSVALPSTISATQLTLDNEEEGVRVANPVNTLSTINTNDTEDMKKITNMEDIQRIKTDLPYSFRTAWKGHYKNSYDNQNLWNAACNGYIEELERLEILDPDFDNRVSIDTDTQRSVWIASGKPEAEINAMSDLEIEKLPYKDRIYNKATIKLLDAIEACDIVFNLY